MLIYQNQNALPNYPVIPKRRKGTGAQLTTKGFIQMFDLGKTIKQEYLPKMDLKNFRSAKIKTLASARKRCTTSALAFLNGIQHYDTKSETETKGKDIDSSRVFINSHQVETQKYEENRLFEAGRVCPGIGLSYFSKFLSNNAKKLIFKFLKRVETKYSFFLQQYVFEPSQSPAYRLMTLKDYLSHVKSEHNLTLLDEQDNFTLQILSTYIMINSMNNDNME